MILKVIELVKEVGAYIRHESESFSADKIQNKGLNDLVSYVDKTAEQKLVEGLKRILPNSGFITEEGTEFNRQDLSWIIDPLDGTTNFVHGLPVFAISVALMDKDELILGVVYEINKDEMFYAEKGKGAFLNGKKILVSTVNSLSQSLLATGFPYFDFEQMPGYLQILNDFMQKTHGLRRMGAAAVDLAYVACGRFEGFFEYNLNPWDVAAGALIIQEAGGNVCDFKGGNNYIFGRNLVTSGHITEQMLEVIQKHWKN